MYLQFNGANTLTHRYLHGDAVDQILADENLTTAVGKVDWMLTDHQGSVRTIYASDNVLQNILRYSAFGVQTESTPSADQHFSYTGREFDAGVGPNGGLIYLRGRYKDPKLGRFLSQDPSGFSSGDVNLYRYAENDSVRMTDPFGLQATSSLGRSVAQAALNPAYRDAIPLLRQYEPDRGIQVHEYVQKDETTIRAGALIDIGRRIEGGEEFGGGWQYLLVRA